MMLWMIRAIKHRQHHRPSLTFHTHERDPKTFVPDSKASELFDRIAALNPQLPPPNAVSHFECIADFVTTHMLH